MENPLQPSLFQIRSPLFAPVLFPFHLSELHTQYLSYCADYILLFLCECIPSSLCEGFTGQAGILPRGPVVILLREPEAEAGRQCRRGPAPGARVLSDVRVPARPAGLTAAVHPWPPGRWHLGPPRRTGQGCPHISASA